ARSRALLPRTWSSVVESAALRDGRLVVRTPPDNGSARLLLMPAARETLDFALRSRRFARPEVLRAVEGLERFVRGEGRWAVGGVLGPPDEVVTAEYVTSDRDSEARAIPSDPERVAWLWNAIRVVQGPERL